MSKCLLYIPFTKGETTVLPEDPPSHPSDPSPLIRDVPGHLFTFEEKMFGMSLTHLLTDLGALAGSVSLTGSLPLFPRVIVCVLITLVVLVAVHGKARGLSLAYWGYLLLRSKMIPKRTVWQPITPLAHSPHRRGEKRPPSVQATWIPLDTLERGVASKSIRLHKTEIVRCWTAFEIEGKNIGLLPASEQLRIFQRFEGFLTGLSFHLHLLSCTEAIHPETAPAFLVQKEALRELGATPRLQALQAESLKAQARQTRNSTTTRHFVVVSASSAEPTLQDPEGMPPSVLGTFLHLLPSHKKRAIPRAQVIEQLRIRASIVRNAIGQLDLRVFPLSDHAMLSLLAQSLAPGSLPLSFVPDLIEEQNTLPASSETPRGATRRPPATTDDTPHQTMSIASLSMRSGGSADTRRRHEYKKRFRGVHATFSYTSPHPHAHLEADRLSVADLLAPSSIHVHPEMLQIQAGSACRYTRTLTVTGYGHHLVCGWLARLHELGVPLLVSCHLSPLDSRFMLLKLEQALTRLESQRLSDQEKLRLSRPDQRIEAEQIRRVSHALASHSLKIFDVSLTICLHAGSPERLEQRCRYVLSHLHDLQVQARSVTLQQDLGWQSCLPTGLDLLQQWNKLTSEVVATLLPGTSGVVGTPTGVFLGTTGSDLAQRSVYLHPWSPDKRVLNPHVVVIGETGTGKTWTILTLVTGLLGQGIADVCVLDRADDYLRLHQALPGESQRYNLARKCPINLFDLPFGPSDVDPDDPTDLLAQFFHHLLIHGLTLLVCDEESKLTKNEEAYLLTVARATYAQFGITSAAIQDDPATLLREPPTLADFLAMMKTVSASSNSMRMSLLERLESASYLFEGGQTRVSLSKPLTIFSTKEVEPRWYPLMMYVVQIFLMRHRALKQDERYLSYIVEEASYLLKHPAGRLALEYGSREFRKYGIGLVTVSQHPRDFLETGQVVLANANTVFFLGMEQTAADLLHLPEALERIVTQRLPGRCVLRFGNEYAPLTIWSNPVYRSIFTTDPVERRAMKQQGRRETINQEEKKTT